MSSRILVCMVEQAFPVWCLMATACIPSLRPTMRSSRALGATTLSMTMVPVRPVNCFWERTLLSTTPPFRGGRFNVFTMNLNPCVQDVHYRKYIETYFRAKEPQWDYVMINDNTRDPARLETRQTSLETLKTTYVPWFRETGATPVFLWTHAYSVESTVPLAT